MDEVEEIKRRIDIVDLISGYLTLNKAGVNYKAICPFHQEKTPSFMVSPEKQIWHCFGCSEGGDVFTFVMKMENLEFGEVLKMLAARAGVELQKRTHLPGAIGGTLPAPDRKSRLFAVNLLAARAFYKILTTHPSGKPALEYLKKRKLTDATMKEFMLGYAPSSRAMKELLKKQGFSDREIESAGSPDRFYKRIIFPISDVMGNIIAFTGRVLDPNQEPKYLNTSETIIFHKSHVLYNLAKARGEIKTKKVTVVVEGQMDVIASWQAEVKNVVATSGTALTSKHLQILYRYSPNIVFAFDSDIAGLASAKKAYEMAITEGFNVKMVNLGEFKDPGEMIAQNPLTWQEAVQRAAPVIDWYFKLAFGEKISNNLTPQEKKEIAQEILPIIKKIPDTIEQAHYVGLLAKKLAVSEQIIFDALGKVGVKKTFKPKVVLPTKRNISALELVMGILLKNPHQLEIIKNPLEDIDFEDKNLLAIYKAFLKRYNADKSDFTLNRLKKDLSRQLQLKIDDLLLIIEEGKEEMQTSDLESAIKILGENHQEKLKSYYAQEIKKAESAKDTNKLKKLIKEFQDAISK